VLCVCVVCVCCVCVLCVCVVCVCCVCVLCVCVGTGEEVVGKDHTLMLCGNQRHVKLSKTGHGGVPLTVLSLEIKKTPHVDLTEAGRKQRRMFETSGNFGRGGYRVNHLKNAISLPTEGG